MAAEPVISHIAVMVDASDRQRPVLDVAMELAINLRARLSGLLVPDQLLVRALDFPYTQYVSSALASVVTMDRQMLDAHLLAVAERLQKLLESRAKTDMLNFSLRVEQDPAGIPHDADLLISQATSANVLQTRQLLTRLQAASGAGSRGLLLLKNDNPAMPISVPVKSLTSATWLRIVWAARMAKGLRRPLQLVIEGASLTPGGLGAWLRESAESQGAQGLSGITPAIIAPGPVASAGAGLLALDLSDMAAQENRSLLTRSTASLLVLNLDRSTP